MKTFLFFLQRLYRNFLQNIFLQAIFLLGIEWLAFHKIFSFWFFHGWEASWLMGTTGGVFTLQSLMQSHGFVSALNLLLFGWNPKGWFATAFILHYFVTIILIIVLSKITKSKLIGFLSGLLFIATTADHDVITWGSFESLYAAQTLGVYVALLFYVIFRNSGKRLFYVLSLITFAFSALLRESGIIFIPMIFIFELIFYQEKFWKKVLKKKINKKLLIRFIILQFPFWLFGLGYLLLRASYGGSPNDYIDQRVQLRILLVHEHRFLEYIKYGLLAFGQYLPPYSLPYPLVNLVKTLFFTRFSINFVNNYFFVIWGWFMYAGFIFMFWLQRKTKYAKHLLFLLSVFTIIIFFYSFAWSTDETFLSIPYSWSENRWRYFAFTTLAPFFVISAKNLYDFSQTFLKKKANIYLKYVFISFIVISVAVNIFFLNKIEAQMFWQNHFPSLRFYQTLTKNFPNLNSQSKFFYYRNSPALNDFLAEFYYIKQAFYPSMKTLPQDWVRSQMYYVVKKFSDGELSQKNFYFMDYSLATGIVNKTKGALSYYSNQLSIDLLPSLVSTVSGDYSAEIKNVPSVEFPYKVYISAALSPSFAQNNNQNQKKISLDNALALSSFMESETSFMQNTKVHVCKTMDNQINEEFHNLRPENTIDGNIQERSRWWADCRPAWVVFDLGQEESIAGFSWGSYNALDYVPLDYEYQISNDNKKWETVKMVKGNTETNKLEKLSHPVEARYVRFFVDETVKRGMLALNEFTVIPESTTSIFSFYTNQKSLFSDMYNFWYLVDNNDFSQIINRSTKPIAWIPFSWTTNPQNVFNPGEQTYFVPFIADGVSHDYSFELPESELYSGNDQFLKRFVNSISFEIPFNSNALQVQSFTYEPLFPAHK